MRPFDILVAGEINPDLILTGNITPEFGQVEKIVDSSRTDHRFVIRHLCMWRGAAWT